MQTEEDKVIVQGDTYGCSGFTEKQKEKLIRKGKKECEVCNLLNRVFRR